MTLKRERVAIRQHGGEASYFSVSEEVCQDGYLAPAPIYTYRYDPSKPVYNTVFIGDNQESATRNNRALSRARGMEITVEDIRTKIQRDPKPFLYTDPVSNKKTRLSIQDAEPWDAVVVFAPARGFSQNREDYES